MIEDAAYKRGVAKIEGSGIEAQLKIREIVSPHDGFVVEVFKKPGETVLPGAPVFQVVDAERLRVTAYANLSDYSGFDRASGSRSHSKPKPLIPHFWRERSRARSSSSINASIPSPRPAASSPRWKTAIWPWRPASKRG